ncbi:hypothetical protein NUU61_002022 [Penicillium alfredii]|uniref:Uncharacterized protein n=1 Tax=Penicillium alfredii TaxID=1506179 RepID=A0A9W9FRJ1_9EURO|nr:uncharacterized protein NUU61_002022 [Penicillium alfredii]KAJ5104675.1 hypothetical protein NUU61_002022 [Penicillium alfredii]
MISLWIDLHAALPVLPQGFVAIDEKSTTDPLRHRVIGTCPHLALWIERLTRGETSHHLHLHRNAKEPEVPHHVAPDPLFPILAPSTVSTERDAIEVLRSRNVAAAVVLPDEDPLDGGATAEAAHALILDVEEDPDHPFEVGDFIHRLTDDLVPQVATATATLTPDTGLYPDTLRDLPTRGYLHHPTIKDGTQP